MTSRIILSSIPEPRRSTYHVCIWQKKEYRLTVFLPFNGALAPAAYTPEEWERIAAEIIPIWDNSLKANPAHTPAGSKHPITDLIRSLPHTPIARPYSPFLEPPKAPPAPPSPPPEGVWEKIKKRVIPNIRNNL